MLFDILRRPEVAQWLGDPRPWPDLARAEAAIETAAAQATSSLPRSRAIVPLGPDGAEAGPPVGSVSADALDPEHHGEHKDEAEDVDEDGRAHGEVHIGWYLHPDRAGQGWATEAASLVLAAMRRHHERVWAVMWPGNLPSAKVCRRLEMTDLGVCDDPWYGTVEYPASHFFGIGDDPSTFHRIRLDRLRHATFDHADVVAPTPDPRWS